MGQFPEIMAPAGSELQPGVREDDAPRAGALPVSARGFAVDIPQALRTLPLAWLKSLLEPFGSNPLSLLTK
jgi:hypothetical protein